MLAVCMAFKGSQAGDWLKRKVREWLGDRHEEMAEMLLRKSATTVPGLLVLEVCTT